MHEFLQPDRPAVILAPMEGLADAPIRALQTEIGAFTYAVAEFLRVSGEVPPLRAFRKIAPEVLTGGRTAAGTPVQVQILGGHPERMAASALVAVRAGARAVDINFGCPAPTVNRHDGGASLLKSPDRIERIVAAIRAAVPPEIPVSAKLRLGWEDVNEIDENAARAAAGGASWITIHGRTRREGYRPPAHWEPIGRVRRDLKIPVVANGDIWTLDDLRRCRDVTGCRHFMLGRGALASPALSHQVARELGLPHQSVSETADWGALLRRLAEITGGNGPVPARHLVCRAKQWLNLARQHGDFDGFETIKRMETLDEIFAALADGQNRSNPSTLRTNATAPPDFASTGCGENGAKGSPAVSCGTLT